MKKKYKKAKSKNITQTIKKLTNKMPRINLNKNKFNTIEMLLIFIMALVFGILIGEMFFSSNKSTISFTGNNSNEINEIKNVYNTIVSEYINEVDKEKLKEAAINGMMSSLGDKHTSYFDEEESETFQDELNGYFVGIGVGVYKKENKPVTISEIYKNSPANKSGLKKGDQLLKINGEDVTKFSTGQISEMIKGKEGKTFIILIKRGKEEKEIKLTTGKVEISSVTTEIIEKENKKIAYIQLSIFASNTDEQLKEELQKIDNQNIKDLIIDLRYNQGGELETAINVASNFLDKKTPIIQISKKKNTEIYYSEGNNNKKHNIVVLINKGSASAAEVVSAALNEQLNVPLVGENTYGKGTVQKTKQLADGTIIKYTIETWKTSKGKSIDGKGVKPTIEIKQNEEYYKTLNKEDDTQLKKAIEIIK